MKMIIKKAEELRRKYGLDDLPYLAGRLGAEVVEYPLGRIIKEAYFKDLGVIVIDPFLHPYKKRHLIAHGLAHHLFHRDRRANYFLDQARNFLETLSLKKHEKEAEFFAGHLLIPEDELNEVIKEEWVKQSLNPIPDLAEKFQVSSNFMGKRLKFLNRYM